MPAEGERPAVVVVRHGTLAADIDKVAMLELLADRSEEVGNLLVGDIQTLDAAVGTRRNRREWEAAGSPG